MESNWIYVQISSSYFHEWFLNCAQACSWCSKQLQWILMFTACSRCSKQLHVQWILMFTACARCSKQLQWILMFTKWPVEMFTSQSKVLQNIHAIYRPASHVSGNHHSSCFMLAHYLVASDNLSSIVWLFLENQF